MCHSVKRRRVRCQTRERLHRRAQVPRTQVRVAQRHAERLVPQDLLNLFQRTPAPERDRVYLEQMLYASYCTSLQDNKALSPGEITQNIRDYNAVVRGTMKTRSPANVPSPLKQPGKEKGSETRSRVDPPVMPPPQPEMKQPAAEKPCERSLVGLKRPPEVFLPTWRSVVNSLRKNRLIHDLQNLFEVWGPIPVGLTGKDLIIYEALFTLNCMGDRGEVRMEQLGTTGRYWGENFENQMIVFRNPS